MERRTLSDKVREAIDAQRAKELADRKGGKGVAVMRFAHDQAAKPQNEPEVDIEALADFHMGVKRAADGSVTQFSHKAPQLPGVRFVPDTRQFTEAEIVAGADEIMGIGRR